MLSLCLSSIFSQWRTGLGAQLAMESNSLVSTMVFPALVSDISLASVLVSPVFLTASAQMSLSTATCPMSSQGPFLFSRPHPSDAALLLLKLSPSCHAPSTTIWNLRFLSKALLAALCKAGASLSLLSQLKQDTQSWLSHYCQADVQHGSVS